MAIAQTHLTYADPSGPFVELTTNFSVLNAGDTGGIIGFAERFDLPPGKHVLDSVDFVLDSIGADSTGVDVVPVMTYESGGGTKLLPDFRDPQAIKRIYTSTKFLSGRRTTIDIGKLSVDNSFFIYIASNLGSNEYRATLHSGAVALDTARAAIVSINSKMLGMHSALVDGNLVPDGTDVQMDIGITYEDTSGVMAHLSSLSSEAAISPNPISPGKIIQLQGAGQVISAEIVDELGRLIQHVETNAGTFITEIATGKLSCGSYHMHLHRIDGSSLSLKLLVE